MWVFGYGSLMWRVGFPFEERRPGYIEGYRRRFWQGSTDHRGVPGAPGRVVTLLSSAADKCWGVAYRVPAVDKDTVLARLDHREKNGYARLRTDVFDASGRPFTEALLYIATEANPHYLGEAPLDAIAEQVVRSAGPSGPNIEYVLELASALRAIGAEDDHVFELERLVRAATAEGTDGRWAP